MKTTLDFKTKEEFRTWLIKNHDSHQGIDLFLYKKGHTDKGLTYEDAVRTALCYGWIDAVTHSYDEVKFIQYFAPRLKTSNWSLSNIKRMKSLLETGDMTDSGLKFFDKKLLDDLDRLIEEEEKAKMNPVEIPEFFQKILKEENSIELFQKETKSAKRRYIAYIMDAKQEKTKIRRCHKVVGIINGEKNNL